MEPLSRPAPPSSHAERARAWIEWFGVGRLLAASLATVVVCAGALWLVSSPPPPTEASLPMATSTTVADELPALTDPTTTAPTTVLIHVAGAVVNPGVYELRPELGFATRSSRRAGRPIGRLERREPGSGGCRCHPSLRSRRRRGRAGGRDRRLGSGSRAGRGGARSTSTARRRMNSMNCLVSVRRLPLPSSPNGNATDHSSTSTISIACPASVRRRSTPSAIW